MTLVTDWVINHAKENPLVVNERVVVSLRDGLRLTEDIDFREFVFVILLDANLRGVSHITAREFGGRNVDGEHVVAPMKV